MDGRDQERWDDEQHKQTNKPTKPYTWGLGVAATSSALLFTFHYCFPLATCQFIFQNFLCTYMSADTHMEASINTSVCWD